MREPLGELRPYLVQILNPLGTVEGTGFLCHPEGFVLTCWHVMESWRQRNRTNGTVRFGNQERDAEWLIDKSDQTADLALLKLTLSDGQKTPYLPLDIHWDVQITHQLETFGYPESQFGQQGIATAPKLEGLTPTPVNEITVYPLVGLNLDKINHGYSGAPVVNRTTQKVIGLVQAKHHKNQAFMIQFASLFERWPELKTFHDHDVHVYEQIRQRLGQLAGQALEQKLHATSFIPLKLEAGHAKREHSEDRETMGTQAGDHGRNWEDFSLEKLVPPNGKFILSADVGTGKTTHLQWLASELVRRTDRMAIVMTCEELERLATHPPKDDLPIWAGDLQEQFPDIDLKQILAVAAGSKKLVFFFDGLDQIRGEDPSSIVKLAFSVAAQNPVLITSRPSAINRSLERDEQICLLRLKPFSRTDQQQYFGAHFQTARTVCALAPNLTQVPMLAYMVRELVANGRLKASATRTELYEEFLDHVLTEHDANVRLQHKPGLIGKVEPALGKLAFDALAQIEPHIQRVPTTVYTEEARIPLRDLIAFGLVNHLIGRGSEALFFTHQSFQEFLAAKYASAHPECIDKVLKERWHPKWAEVIRFLVGLQGETLVKRILDEPDNVIHSNLFLAAICAGETTKLSVNLNALLIEPLIKLSTTPPFRSDVIQGFGALGRWLSETQLQWLADRLGDKELVVRLAAVEALEPLSDRLTDATVSAIADRLWDKDDGVRWTTIQMLGRLGNRLTDATISAIANRLQDKDDGVRWTTIQMLGRLGNRLTDATVSAIANRLRDKDDDVRRAAVEALESLSDRLTDATVSTIADRLRDKDDDVRWTAVEALEPLSNRLTDATISAIANRLQDKDDGVRWTTIQMLGRLGNRLTDATVSAIVDRLGDKELGVRRAAVEALESLSDRLTDATISAIADRLQDKDDGVRWTTVEALEPLSDRLTDATVSAIVDRLWDKHDGVCLAAIQMLGRLDNRLTDATVSAIADRLWNKDDRVRLAAIRTLGRLGNRLTDATVSAIADQLRNKDSQVCQAAIRTLGQLGDRLTDTTVSAIVDRLKDKDWDVRRAAIWMLEPLSDRLTDATVSAIADQLRNKDNTVCKAAIRILGQLGDHLTDATVSAIVDRLEDKNWGVHRAAVTALKELGTRLDGKPVRKLTDMLASEKYKSAVYEVLSQLYRSGVRLRIIAQGNVRQRSVKVANPTAPLKRGQVPPRKKRTR